MNLRVGDIAFCTKNKHADMYIGQMTLHEFYVARGDDWTATEALIHAFLRISTGQLMYQHLGDGFSDDLILRIDIGDG